MTPQPSAMELIMIEIKFEDFMSFNITQLLTQQRRNGLSNLIETIRSKVAVL